MQCSIYVREAWESPTAYPPLLFLCVGCSQCAARLSLLRFAVLCLALFLFWLARLALLCFALLCFGLPAVFRLRTFTNPLLWCWGSCELAHIIWKYVYADIPAWDERWDWKGSTAAAVAAVAAIAAPSSKYVWFLALFSRLPRPLLHAYLVSVVTF